MLPAAQSQHQLDRLNLGQLQSALEPHYDRLIEQFGSLPPSCAVGIDGGWYNAQEVVDALHATRSGIVLLDVIGKRLQIALITLVEVKQPAILSLHPLTPEEFAYLKLRWADYAAKQRRSV